MIMPNRKNLAIHSADGHIWLGQYAHMHPNPRFFKYLWRIFTADTPWENAEFFRTAPRLCTHDAMAMMDALWEARQPQIIYNQRLPRKDLALPFDWTSERWSTAKFACAYDDDADPVWNGFK